MAFTRDSIKKLGITDDEVITKILDAHHAEFDPVKDKADQYDAEKERADTLKADYDEQSKSIEALKASVGDKEALEKQIKDLQDTAATKDAEHQKALNDMQTRLDNTEFDKLLDTAITKAGGRRSASIRAELNIDDLKASSSGTTFVLINSEASLPKASPAVSISSTASTVNFLPLSKLHLTVSFVNLTAPAKYPFALS